MDAEYARSLVALAAALMFDAIVLGALAVYIRHRRRS